MKTQRKSFPTFRVCRVSPFSQRQLDIKTGNSGCAVSGHCNKTPRLPTRPVQCRAKKTGPHHGGNFLGNDRQAAAMHGRPGESVASPHIPKHTASVQLCSRTSVPAKCQCSLMNTHTVSTVGFHRVLRSRPPVCTLESSENTPFHR